MKKLSELVAYKNELDLLSTGSARTSASMELAKITHLTQDDDLIQQLKEFDHAFTKFDSRLAQLRQDLQDQISEAERPWIVEGYLRYDKGEANYAEDILNIRQNNAIDATPFRAKIKQYSDWKYPAMIIRPAREEFVDDMVAYDPLYLVDLSHEFLRPAIEKFNARYQNRLRPYVVSENLDEPILKQIPDGQFGLCVAFNYFNFRPFEIIKKYLEEIYQKLKPGGTFVFTFNDCDRRSAVELVERHYCCYTPGHLVRELIATVGYDIVYSWNDDGPTTWIEVRRPGLLASIKGGQTLAKVLPIPEPEPEPVDDLTVAQLREQVLALNLYDADHVKYGFGEAKLRAILAEQANKN
jgi:SAM-dependent methyltransferase